MNIKVLFVHTNYPAQFRFLVKEFISHKCDVWFASHTKRHPPLPEVKWIQLEKPKTSKKYLASQIAAVTVFRQLLDAKRRHGLNPDVIYIHTGWGLGAFIRDIFPRAKIIAYSEWWFQLHSQDFTYDVDNPHIDHNIETRLAMVLRNKEFSYELIHSDAIISPTTWQKSQLPTIFQEKCHVIFDGIDTNFYKPRQALIQQIDQLKNIPVSAKLLTYATRGLEPYRGFPEFISAAEFLLQNDNCWHIVIAGQDKINYHKSKTAPKNGYGSNAMDRFRKLGLENRVHMVGTLPLSSYLILLQSSDLHCYFTRPYVLSWSLLESSLVGCNLIVSDTDPVKEFLKPSDGTLMVDYTSNLLGKKLLEASKKTRKINIEMQRKNLANRDYLAKTVDRQECIKRHMRLVKNLIE